MRRSVRDAALPFCIGALAVGYAVAGSGWPPRRAAIAFMMGSWGARLAVHLLYSRSDQTVPVPSRRSIGWRAAAAIVLSLPALAASTNPAETFSAVELAAAVVWFVAFTGEVSSDRRPLRRYAFRAAVWAAYAMFALARLLL